MGGCQPLVGLGSVPGARSTSALLINTPLPRGLWTDGNETQRF